MSSLINFTKRHKKKFIFSILFFGGGYLAIKYSIYKLKQTLLLSANGSHLANKEFLVMRKHEHYLTIKQTSDEAILELIGSMKDQINERFSSNQLLEQLKQKPTNKLEIWENLKIICIAKCLTNVYAISLLSLFVKVELNIIGAYLFLNNTFDFSFSELNTETNQDPVLSANVQQLYLENIENFVKIGFPRLMEDIERYCEESFKEVNLKENLTTEILNEKFTEIRNKLENKMSNELISQENLSYKYLNQNCHSNFILEYLMPVFKINESSYELDNLKKNKSQEEVLYNLNLETFDLLSSFDFQFCMNSVLNSITDKFFNSLTGSMVQQIFCNEINNVDPVSIKLPFAKLIPILEKSSSIFQTDPSFLKNLLNDNNLNLFSANIYEAFSIQTNKQLENSFAEFDEFGKISDLLKSSNSILNQVF